MSFRRSSSLSREDGLTLEQRLVMQLTAAMRHDDSMHAVDDSAPGHAASHEHAAAQSHSAHPAGPASAHAGHQHAGHDALAHHRPPQPGQAQDIHHMDANELSTMLRTLGASLESLGSAIGGNAGNAGPADHHHHHHHHHNTQPFPSGPTTAGHHELAPHTGLHSGLNSGLNTGHHASADQNHSLLGSLDQLSQLGNLGNLLSSVGVHDHSGTDLSSSLEALNHLDLSSLGSLANLGALGHSQPGPATAGSDQHHLASHQDASSALDSAALHLDRPGAQQPEHQYQHSQQQQQQQQQQQHQSHQEPEHEQQQEHRHQLQEQALRDTLRDTLRESGSTPGGQTTTNAGSDHASSDHASLGLSQIEIDPDVSSIQSVLHSLLTGGSGSGIFNADASDHAAHEHASTTSSLTAPSAALSDSQTPSSAGPSHAQPADSTKEFDLPSLSNFGLETEDQMLVESLRSAIESQLSGTAAAAQQQPSTSSDAASAALSDAASLDLDSLRQRRASGARAAPRPRTQSRAKKARTHSSLEDHEDLATSSFRDQHSDFGASDPDTLRAIQQALLSALGPSASTTSLTESLTSELKASAAAAAAAGTETTSTSAETATRNKQPAPASARPELSLRLQPESQPPSSTQPATTKTTERLFRVPAKKTAPKVTKPTERDRQKLREENAARKRRWREENVLQNRDNDLRARIIRRAQTMYGESDSAAKSEWIEAEYQRRRQKRILRADINSLVANAMESARTRAASEQAGSQRVSDQQPLTLTQQTRQIASSQLSELFRRSNAVLEPQLHAEKLSVPLAPYLLVPSPSRPPYKVEWKHKQPSASPAPAQAPAASPSAAAPAAANANANADAGSSEVQPPAEASATPAASKDLHTASSEKSQSDEAVAVKAGGPEAGTDERPGVAAPPKSAASDAASDVTDAVTKDVVMKDATGDVTKDAAKDAANMAAKDAAKDAANIAAKDVAKDVAKDAVQQQQSATRITSMRPKHRYGLVGNAQLGVPPNLAAIYHKMTAMASPSPSAAGERA